MESHLLQMRGLKLSRFRRIEQRRKIVASFTDAWIETLLHLEQIFVPLVASFTDAWIETTRKPGMSVEGKGRIFYRCVD